MNLVSDFGISGVKRLASIAGTIALLSSSTALAQVSTINGKEISDEVYNLFYEMRYQKPASQAAPTEREMALEMLEDIYLLTTQPSADDLAKDPRVKAQIELQTRSILAQAVAADYVKNNSASDEEVLAAYNEQVKANPPQEFKARHILVETQGEATDVITQLDGGADFAELAKEKSTGPSGPNGGDLGWFGPNQMVAPFSAAVSELGDGAYTKTPVQTQFGWHVILREDSRQSTPPTLESVRDVVKQRVEQQKLQDYLAQLRESK